VTKSFLNSSKLFSNGDFFSNSGANQDNVVQDNRLFAKPTRDASVG
jgi:hypothetical protein